MTFDHFNSVLFFFNKFHQSCKTQHSHYILTGEKCILKLNWILMLTPCCSPAAGSCFNSPSTESDSYLVKPVLCLVKLTGWLGWENDWFLCFTQFHHSVSTWHSKIIHDRKWSHACVTPPKYSLMRAFHLELP